MPLTQKQIRRIIAIENNEERYPIEEWLRRLQQLPHYRSKPAKPSKVLSREERIEVFKSRASRREDLFHCDDVWRLLACDVLRKAALCGFSRNGKVVEQCVVEY